MKKVILLLLILLSSLTTQAQQGWQRVENKKFNFGMTVGLKSSLPVINSLSIDGIDANNLQMQYRVGYSGSIFGRINIDHIFLQPTISWHHSSSEVKFSLPSSMADNIDATSLTDARLSMTFEAIEIPLLVGYKIIKEGPYALSLMAGPQLKYSYKTDYTFHFENSQNRFSVDRHHFDVDIVMGVGVSIWRLFFDFKYEFGLNKMDSDFKNLNPSESTLKDIAIDKRINVISFSLGLLF